MGKAFFPGSFNPFTIGHADIVERALKMSDSVTIGIGYNVKKASSAENARLRMETIARLYEDDDRVEVVTYSGLTVEAVRKFGADFMVRGVRNAEDFQYEFNLAAVNKNISGIDTFLIPTSPSLSFVSSSMVNELLENGAEEEAKKFLPHFRDKK